MYISQGILTVNLNKTYYRLQHSLHLATSWSSVDTGCLVSSEWLCRFITVAMNTIEYSKIDMFFLFVPPKWTWYCIATTATTQKKLGKGLDGSDPLDPMDPPEVYGLLHPAQAHRGLRRCRRDWDWNDNDQRPTTGKIVISVTTPSQVERSPQIAIELERSFSQIAKSWFAGSSGAASSHCVDSAEFATSLQKCHGCKIQTMLYTLRNPGLGWTQKFAPQLRTVTFRSTPTILPGFWKSSTGSLSSPPPPPSSSS